MHAWSFGSVANVVVDILSHHSLIWPHHAHYVAQATKIFILPLLINKEKKKKKQRRHIISMTLVQVIMIE